MLSAYYLPTRRPIQETARRHALPLPAGPRSDALGPIIAGACVLVAFLSQLRASQIPEFEGGVIKLVQTNDERLQSVDGCPVNLGYYSDRITIVSCQSPQQSSASHLERAAAPLPVPSISVPDWTVS